MQCSFCKWAWEKRCCSAEVCWGLRLTRLIRGTRLENHHQTKVLVIVDLSTDLQHPSLPLCLISPWISGSIPLSLPPQLETPLPSLSALDLWPPSWWGLLCAWLDDLQTVEQRGEERRGGGGEGDKKRGEDNESINWWREINDVERGGERKRASRQWEWALDVISLQVLFHSHVMDSIFFVGSSPTSSLLCSFSSSLSELRRARSTASSTTSFNVGYFSWHLSWTLNSHVCRAWDNSCLWLKNLKSNPQRPLRRCCFHLVIPACFIQSRI